MTLGEKIYRLRTEQGLSQEAFGEKLGVSRQSVSKWETDQSVPELDKIVAISDCFRISTDRLLKESEDIYGTVNETYTAVEEKIPAENGLFQTTCRFGQKRRFEYQSKKRSAVCPLCISAPAGQRA